MSMSDHERLLLVTGTYDTSGIGASPAEDFREVSLAFAAEDVPLVADDETEPEPADDSKPVVEEETEEPVVEEPVVEPKDEQPKDATPAKRAPVKRAAKKTTARKPQAKPAAS